MSTSRQIVFIVPPKVHLLDLNGPAHIFYEARAHAASLTLQFVNCVVGSEIESSAGLYFSQLKEFNNISLTANDWIFIPGLESSIMLNDSFLEDLHPFLEWLKQQALQGVQICSVCTGAFLVAEAGLLNYKNCTTHWKYIDVFQKRYPETEVLPDRLFVKSENFYSSAGVASGIDLALYVLEQCYGSAFAADIAKEVVVYLRRTDADPQLSVFLQYRNHMDQRIHKIQDLLAQHLEKPLTIEAIAEAVHMSPRNVTRLFKKTTHITPGQYIEKLRVEKAIQLLTDGHKVAYVASLCGLKSTNQLRSLMKKYRGLLPSELLG